MIKTTIKFNWFSVDIYYLKIKSALTKVKVVVTDEDDLVSNKTDLSYKDWVFTFFGEAKMKLTRKHKLTGKEYDTKHIKMLYKRMCENNKRDDKEK